MVIPRFHWIRGFQALTLIASLSVTGCFHEQSFPMQSGDVVPVRHETSSARMTTRRWLARTHGRLQHLLPRGERRALLTEDLVDEQNRPRDVFEHFQRDPDRLQSLFHNYWGLMFSVQCIGDSSDSEALSRPRPGYEEVTFDISDTVQTRGWLGLAKDGDTVREADCIILVPGFFGDNNILRQRALADALIASGFHVLAYDNRGCGVTNLRRPDVYHSFGVMETRDLLVVSDWLEDKPFVRRTGLIGFCWGANQTLLAAWYENCPDHHPAISDRLAERMPPLPKRQRFRAGILSFSPTLSFEEILEMLEEDRAMLSDPALSALQDNVVSRAAQKQHAGVGGSLQTLIEREFACSGWTYPGAVPDGLEFLRLLSYKGKAAVDKLKYARVPVVIVYGSNDPLAPAQQVVDFMAGLDNPNVAAVILHSGGHVGFVAYARSYYFSLIMNFFDPVYGAAAMSERPASTPTREVQTMNTHAR